MLFFVSCGNDNGENNTNGLRTADPCNAWSRAGWMEGPESIITPELRDGKASHMWPSDIVYYSVLENTIQSQGILINPVLILVYLENADLLSFDKDVGDFEMRLLWAVGYDVDSKIYNGFYPQLVAATYQFQAFQKRGLSFEAAQISYPFISARMSFSDAYAKYAKVMNDILGTSLSLHPDSRGYYQDFSGLVDSGKIQLFFERVGSPLRENIFNQFPIQNTLINYANMSAYCE